MYIQLKNQEISLKVQMNKSHNKKGIYNNNKELLCALKYEPDNFFKSSKHAAHCSSVLLRKSNNNKKCDLSIYKECRMIK